MRNGMATWGVLLLAGAALADEVTYVACDPSLALNELEARHAWVYGLTHPKEGDGTVHPKARVGSFRLDDLMLRPASVVSDAPEPLAEKTCQFALDASSPEATALDVIRFDFAEQGKFTKESSLTLRPAKAAPDARRGATVEFGPQTMPFKLGPITFPVTVSGAFTKDRWLHEGGSFDIRLCMAMGGSCRFGDKTYPVRLIDGTGNFRVDDPAKLKVEVKEYETPRLYAPGDTVVVDAGDGKFAARVQKAYYGQPLLVDGKWYVVKLDSDAMTLSAVPLACGSTTLKVNHPRWTCTLVGKHYLVNVAGGKEPVVVPSDEYAIAGYRAWSAPEGDKDAASLLGQGAVGDRPEEAKRISLEDGKTVELGIGSPLIAHAAVESNDHCVYVSIDLTDSAGCKITGLDLGGGKRPPPPKVSFVDADGKTVGNAKTEYGGQLQCSGSWRPPKDLKGTFAVKLAYDPKPFPVKLQDTTVILP